VDVAEVFNKPWFVDQWRFKSITQDIMDVDYDKHTWQYWSNANNRMSKPITDSPDTIINTSCEHISDFAEWYNKIPNGKLVVLQSNNYYEVEEHVNCVSDIYEFKDMAPMSTLLYMGMRELPKYTRFMLIGYK
jgi:UDP-N-acetylmuramyl tripeptide synthase